MRDFLADEGSRLPISIATGRWRYGFRQLDRNQEPVTPSRHSLDKTGRICRIAQGRAELHDGGVDAAIELHDRVVRPEPFSDLLPRNHLAFAKKEHLQNLELLLRKAYFSPIPLQLSGRKVEFERPEASKFGKRVSGMGVSQG